MLFNTNSHANGQEDPFTEFRLAYELNRISNSFINILAILEIS